MTWRNFGGVAALGLSSILSGCGAGYRALPAGTPEQPRIQPIDLGIANAYVVYGSRPVLVDTGPANSAAKLEKALDAIGIARGNLALVILTHGHADHAGSAKQIHDDWRVPIAAGIGDTEMLVAGHNRELIPMSLTARLIRPFVDSPFPPFHPDIEVAAPIDLRPYGIAGNVTPAPGHTPGSLVLLLEDGDAFVGDLMAGGYFGGAIAPTSPGTHYFHDDQRAAEAQICTTIKRGAKRLFLGHGGPVTAADAWQRFCKDTR